MLIQEQIDISGQSVIGKHFSTHPVAFRGFAMSSIMLQLPKKNMTGFESTEIYPSLGAKVKTLMIDFKMSFLARRSTDESLTMNREEEA